MILGVGFKLALTTSNVSTIASETVSFQLADATGQLDTISGMVCSKGSGTCERKRNISRCVGFQLKTYRLAAEEVRILLQHYLVWSEQTAVMDDSAAYKRAVRWFS